MNDMSRIPASQDAPANGIHQMARDGRIDRIRLALAAGENPDAPDSWGMTPLMVAVQHRRVDVIEILGRAGADPNLARIGMDRFTPLHLAVRRNSIAAVDALLALGADAAKRTWLTPLDWAESRPVIKALVKAGADPDARCPQSGQTPLHRRSCRCRPEPVAALLDAGANHSARDGSGRTPLHQVTLGQRRDDVAQAVKLLLDAGADPEARDLNGDTVTDLARSCRDAVALRALAEARVGNGRASDDDQCAHATRAAEDVRLTASARGSRHGGRVHGRHESDRSPP